MPPVRKRPPIKVLEMQFENIRGSPHIGLYGDPGMGKTWFAKRLVKFFVEERNIRRVFVVVGNKDTASEWYDIVPELNVYDCKNLEHIAQLDEIFEYSSKRVSQLREEHQDRRDGSQFIVPSRYQYLAVFDDTGGNEEFMHSNTVLKFATESRHAAFITIWNLQYINMLPKKARTLHSHLGVFNTPSNTQVDYIYKEYTGKMIDRKSFEKLLNRLTPRQNHLMWIDKSPTTPRTFSNMFRYFENVDMPVISTDIEPLREFAKTYYVSDKTRETIDAIIETTNAMQKSVDKEDAATWTWQSQVTETLDHMDPRMIASIVGQRQVKSDFDVRLIRASAVVPHRPLEHISEETDDS